MRSPVRSSRPRAAARRVLAFALSCCMMVSVCGLAACSPAITNGNSASDAPAASSSAIASVASIERVESGDALLDFAANASTAVLNGADADASGGNPENVQEKNLCFSPVSLYLACTLLGMGTQGTAQGQVLSLLGVPDGDALEAQAQEIRQQLEDTYGDAVIQVADSVWAGQGYAFTDSYLDDVEALGAGAFDVDFGTDEANRQISDWISEQTKGLLKPDIETELGQAAMLINTIYFKDAWASQFDVARDEVALFRAPGAEVQANYMRQEVADSAYLEGDGYTAASLAFSGGSTMTFVRPDDDVMLYQLIQSAEDVQELLSLDLEMRSVDWWIPRFQTDTSLRHLADALKALGVVNVFSPEEPDAFAPMLATDGGEGFCVSDVLQDSHFALDEDGVEAAAFTSVGIEKMALMPETEPVEFKLDRSFLYYVTSPDGVVLFVGVLYDPSS